MQRRYKKEFLKLVSRSQSLEISCRSNYRVFICFVGGLVICYISVCGVTQ